MLGFRNHFPLNDIQFAVILSDSTFLLSLFICEKSLNTKPTDVENGTYTFGIISTVLSQLSEFREK